MPVNINGYQLTNNSGLTFGSSQTKFDASGRLIMPNMPGFFGSKTDTPSVIRQWPWRINSTTFNINNCWNTSTGLFTCPAAGLYFTSWNGINQGNASGYIGLVRNGSLYTFTHFNTNFYWESTNLQTIINCSSGDTLGWAIHIAPAPDNGSGAGSYAGNHNMSTIWYIG